MAQIRLLTFADYLIRSPRPSAVVKRTDLDELERALRDLETRGP